MAARTFEEVFSDVILKAKTPPRHREDAECRSPEGKDCRLCYAVDLPYRDEVRLKNEALQRFWKSLNSSLPLSPLIVSPRGRSYRAITKRKVFRQRQGFRLGLIDPSMDEPSGSFVVQKCAIEPEEHARIYSTIHSALQKAYARPLLEKLSYIIIKGSYSEITVIFNVRSSAREIFRAMNTLSKTLTNTFSSIAGVFVYLDTSSERYYMGSKNPSRVPELKKVFGKAEIYHKACGKSFLYSPASFSQVNPSIIDLFVERAIELLDPTPLTPLFDLYCGYGLFALCMAHRMKSVTGVEHSALSVRSASANAVRQKVRNARFMQSEVSGESIARILREDRAMVLLDPPRKGTQPGVIEAITARRPVKALHIFCEIDLLRRELKRWESGGYKPTRVIPVDMFPGTSAVEMMVLLEASA